MTRGIHPPGPVETGDWQLQSYLVRATPRLHNLSDPEAIALLFLLGVVPFNRITPDLIAPEQNHPKYGLKYRLIKLKSPHKFRSSYLDINH